jgi:hypothetical protein
MPLIGGSSFRAGSGTLSKRSLNAAMKQAVINNATIKQKNIDIASVANFLANTHYVFNPLGNIPIGTGENARICNDIVVKNITLSFTFSSRLDMSQPVKGAPVFIRLIWLRAEADTVASSDLFVSSLGGIDLYKSNMSASIVAQLEKDKNTILSDTIVKIPQSNILDSNNVLLYTTTCPVKDFVFKYSSSSSAFSSVNKNVYLIAFPYTTAATTGTTALVNYQFTSSVEFVDSR